MKVTWITTKHSPDRGGMATSSLRLVNGLKDNQFRVQVIYLNSNLSQKTKFLKKQLIKNHFAKFNSSMVVQGVNAPKDIESLFWHVKEVVKDSTFIGFGGDLSGYIGTVWAKWTGKKSIVLFRGNDFDRGIYDMQKAWMLHFILEHADVIGCVSKEMTSRVRNMRNGATVYLPNGVNLDEWQIFNEDLERARRWREENIPKDKKIVAIFGQLKDKKGLKFTFDLFKSTWLREKAVLLTVGDIPNNLGVNEVGQCHFWYHVPFQNRLHLPMFYLISDVVFIPSIYDGMPNVLLEALALGRIVVASRAGGMPDVIKDGDNGFLFDCLDENEALSALEKAIFIDEDRRMDISKRARWHIENNFTHFLETQRLSQLLFELI